MGIAERPHCADAADDASERKQPQGNVGFANLKNQVNRRAVKKGFEFTLMVVGTMRRCGAASYRWWRTLRAPHRQRALLLLRRRDRRIGPGQVDPGELHVSHRSV